MIDSAYEATRWTYLFAASMGALATLTGLVFVAVSVNVRARLENPGPPERAAATLVVLLGPLVVSALVLIPGQSVTALGIEIGCVTPIFAAMLAGLVEKLRGHGVSGNGSGNKPRWRHSWSARSCAAPRASCSKRWRVTGSSEGRWRPSLALSRTHGSY